jgi:hypothetical protein
MLRAVHLIIFGTTSSASGGGGSSAPTLNFSSATNSQYVPLIFGGYLGI